ncbi:MAG: EAL domain-containing protein [Desulfuromonadaceae bacterium]|nr:EAL domain-containing protein [Desulfuromonadaceae bacterium]
MQETETNLHSSKRLACLAFFIFCALVMLVGVMLYRYQRRSEIETAKDNLQVVHELYSQQIAYWRSQHLTMARTHANNPALRLNMARFLAARSGSAPADAREEGEAVKQILLPLKQNPEYHAAIVIDTHGAPLAWMDISGNEHRLSPSPADIDAGDIQLCLQRREPLFSSIYLPANTTKQDHQHMNLLLPLELEYGQDTFTALLVIIINPEAFLMPLLESWPLPHATAEAILIRRHDDSIVRLSKPKLYAHKSLQPVVPTEDREVVGSFIKAGHAGFVVSRDYKDEQVLAWIAPVHDTPWILVTKIDQREVMAPLKRTAVYISGVGGSAILLAALILGMWWRQHAFHYRTHILQRDREHHALSQRFDNISRYANDIILLCDESGAIIDANERALGAYGHSIEKLSAMNLRDLCDVGPSEWTAMLLQLDSGQGLSFECNHLCADSSMLPVEISAGWINTGEHRMLQAIIRDISERREAQEHLHRRAYYDEITGLPNRTLATERLRAAIGRTSLNNTQVALLFIDVDLFKNINDTLGHIVGDKVLLLFAERINKVLRDNAMVSRFGSDEFLLLIEGVNTTADIIAVVDRVVESIGEPVNIEGFEISATVSIGISVAPDDDSDVDQLIRYADTAMYRAKERGRNCYQFFTPDMHQRARQRLSLEGALRRAVERKELMLRYQPQVDMRSGRVLGCEALLRWHHPERGMVPPAEFIGLAEEIGLIHEIGAWVLEEACRQVGIWQHQGYADLTIAVNVSPLQLQNNHLATNILHTVKLHQLRPNTLEVEITETSLMRDTALAISQMRRLSRGGISLAIDDFGTGYSSLGHLHRFPINKLKIDRSFVSNIGKTMEQGADTIPRAIINLAHQLDLNVIAEGVENMAQQNFLLEAACIIGQGYLYSKPLSAEAFTTFLYNANGDKKEITLGE